MAVQKKTLISLALLKGYIPLFVGSFMNIASGKGYVQPKQKTSLILIVLTGGKPWLTLCITHRMQHNATEGIYDIVLAHQNKGIQLYMQCLLVVTMTFSTSEGVWVLP